MNTLEQQTLFEIVMSIGNGTDLKSMLQHSLSVIMRKLGCNMGVVARVSFDDVQLVHTIPHHMQQSIEITELCRQAVSQPGAELQPRSLGTEVQFLEIFSLPHFGVLILGKSGNALSKPFRGALNQIAKKLALACISCDQAQAIKAAQEQTQLVLDSTAEGICGTNMQGQCTFANASFLSMFGYTHVSEIIGKRMRELILGRPSGETTFVVTGSPLFSPARYKQKLHSANEMFLRKDGTAFPAEYWSTPIEHDGSVSGAVVTFVDITERKQAEKALQSSEARLSALIRTIPDLIWMKDANGIYQSCNPMFERFFGASESEIVGKSDYDFVDKDLAGLFRENDLRAIAAGKPVTNEERVVFADDGHHALLETIKAPTYDASGKLLGVLGIARDITQRKASEDQIKNLAFYDSLTGLPNRRLVLDRLQHALNSRARTGKEGALLFLDLDNFKTLNDTLGHGKGDLLLQLVAERLRNCIRESDTAARFGGDEFIVMLEDLSENPIEAATDVKAVGEKILNTLNQPYDLNGLKYHNTPSIGATLFTDCQNSVDELMKRADLAMYQAKSAGRNTLRFFDPQMQAVVNKRTDLEKEMREGLHQKQFILFYQPQVNGQGQVTGSEALLRWIHPDRGMVSPADFIPVAEATGLILPLGQWVLETACEQLSAWAKRPDTEHLTVAVNVSARQIRQINFVEQVLDTIQRNGTNPHRLKLELTESMLLDDVEDIITKMTVLKSSGVGFSLDDFGTGYSSLSYLKRLPLDQLKIDQSFVRDILEDPHDAAISQAIVTLAKSLDLSSIAEGVETAEQRDCLAAQGCYAYQGYFFSRPLPIEKFDAFIESRKALQQI